MLDYTLLPKIFKTVVEKELDYETLNHLEDIWESGSFKNPTGALTYRFSTRLTDILTKTVKLYGISPSEYHIGSGQLGSVIFSIFMQSYPNFNESTIKDAVSPRKFIVSSDLPFVGGSRQGELDGVSYQEIVHTFGEPTYDEPSGDSKVQVEWDIRFDNGVRASIYDYKQYNIHPEQIDYWSIGGNSPESSFEVYKSLGLI